MRPETRRTFGRRAAARYCSWEVAVGTPRCSCQWTDGQYRYSNGWTPLQTAHRDQRKARRYVCHLNTQWTALKEVPSGHQDDWCDIIESLGGNGLWYTLTFTLRRDCHKTFVVGCFHQRDSTFRTEKTASIILDKIKQVHVPIFYVPV